MVELRDVEKIREAREQSSYSFVSVIITSLLLFLLGIITGVYFSDFLKEIFNIFPLSP